MVEYVIVLTVASLVAMMAMYLVGYPMVQYFLYARALLVYPT